MFTIVIYRSAQWEALVKQGYITLNITNGIALVSLIVPTVNFSEIN